MEDYKIVRSRRKTLCIEIDREAQVTVRAPFNVPEKEIEKFVNACRDRIENSKAKMREAAKNRKVFTEEELKNLQNAAKNYIPERVATLSAQTGIVPTGIKITSARTRLGSCSPKNSLCFSFYLMCYPKEAIDYVIIHELAHTVHHNHGSDFWQLVQQLMPDYKERQKLLRQPVGM